MHSELHNLAKQFSEHKQASAEVLKSRQELRAQVKRKGERHSAACAQLEALKLKVENKGQKYKAEKRTHVTIRSCFSV